MKKRLIWISAVLFLIFAGGAYKAPEKFWQPLLINISTTFLSVFVGVVVVNIYLERSARKNAVGALLRLANTAVATFHNFWLETMWGVFSKNDYSNIHREYMTAGGDAKAISPANRAAIYELVKSKQSDLVVMIQEMETALEEISSLVGWDLDSDLLAASLSCRNSIRLFRSTKIDDSDFAKEKLTEHILDIETYSQVTRARLIELAEIKNPDK